MQVLLQTRDAVLDIGLHRRMVAISHFECFTQLAKCDGDFSRDSLKRHGAAHLLGAELFFNGEKALVDESGLRASDRCT